MKSVLYRGDLGTRVTEVGVPGLVLFWAAAGSLAAILYRFYTEKGRIRFSSEVRWLIARPIIGIIMGAVVYLALQSGFILMGQPSSNADAASTTVKAQIINQQLSYVIAFLSGFSDKFYLGVINLLVTKTVRDSGKEPDKTETEKKPDKTGTEKERTQEPKSAGGLDQQKT